MYIINPHKLEKYDIISLFCLDVFFPWIAVVCGLISVNTFRLFCAAFTIDILCLGLWVISVLSRF